MSSILEALKKLEDEKAARLSGAGNMTGKVVKSQRRTRQRPLWWLPAGMAVASVIAAIATYAVMGGFSTGGVPARSPVVAPALQPQSVPTPAAHPSPPVVPSPAVRGRVPSPRQSSPAARQALRENAATQPRPFPSHEEKPVAPPQPASVAEPPSLKISGIGWQKDGADRLAIVNGRAVSEGSVIEGARVEEIYPDRVRFSIAGRTFEIPIGKTSGDNP